MRKMRTVNDGRSRKVLVANKEMDQCAAIDDDRRRHFLQASIKSFGTVPLTISFRCQNVYFSVFLKNFLMNRISKRQINFMVIQSSSDSIETI